jgi:hypothetical protein
LLFEISFVAKRKILSNMMSDELYKSEWFIQAYIEKWGKIRKELPLLWRELEVAQMNTVIVLHFHNKDLEGWGKLQCMLNKFSCRVPTS